MAGIVAQAVTGNGWQTWLLVLTPLVAGGFLSLGGVWLGSTLDRKARREERHATEQAELRKDASDVMGTARVVLTAMGPDSYALWANEGLYDEIDKRRHEANAIRPRLAALAVRWPDAALELNAVEHHLGTMPNRLGFLVHRVLDPNDQFVDYLNELKTEHEAIVDALNRVIQKLAEPTDAET